MKLIVILLLSLSFLSFSLGDELKFDHFVVPGADDEAVAYWTPERMKAAIPKDIINDANFNDTKFKPDGAPGHTSAAGPGGKPFNVGHEDVCSFSSGYAPSYTTYPWNVVGKVFFTQGGVNYVCSASAICNFGIVTAGHCVNSGAGVWSTNFVFVPGYNNGAAPYGMFSAYNLYAFTAWTTQASPCYDYAFVTLCRYNNQPVGYYVGWFGLTWNAGYNNSWTTLGYPAAAPFTGQYNYYTSSSYCTQDGRCSPNPVGVGSDSTGGCSGGPWVIGFGSTNYVNGVNSYGYSTLPNVLFSPYFDSNVYTLYNLACPTTFLAC